ncbi:hypothetical protein FB45DRAFT_1086545 [Roridomyces roridus]|uniref:Uncharacterized protein n=1 Tax=Roridomyces roridus TaxID=1738132 RepID=A0AAD7BLV0_9AGAR|nr:hypothetical protein FB45DRAFT_1086545 [Roridomyces roridus]
MTLPSVQACQARRLLQFRKYNDRNFEIRNKNTRERMARLRSGLSPEERAARLLARRESDRQYRQKNRATIADKAKYHRQAAAAKKEELRRRDGSRVRLIGRLARNVLDYIYVYPLYCLIMNTDVCKLPFWPDPEQSTEPNDVDRKYLVMGKHCARPGVYTSWSIANAEWKSHPDNSCEHFYEMAWAKNVWRAACERGHHTHLVPLTASLSPILSPPASPGKKKKKKKTVSSAAVPFAVGAPTPPTFSNPSPTKTNTGATSQHPGPRVSPIPTGTASASPTKGKARIRVSNQPVYAARCDEMGAIFASRGEAREWYRQRLLEGMHPSLFIGASLKDSMAFVEEFFSAPRTQEAREEEERIRRERVKEDIRRADHRRGVLELLRDVRDSSDSEHSSDESDTSRCTDSLELELEARLRFGTDWRSYYIKDID